MATFHQFKNNCVGTVQNNPLAIGGTNLIVDSTLDSKLSGLTFPFWLTLWDANTNPNTTASVEIVEVTARPSANNYTIVRAQQSTSASAHAQNSNCALLFTQGNLQEAVALGTIAQGSILYIDSAGKPHMLAPGSAGTFLQTQGAGADPAWAASIVANYGDGSDGNVTISSPTTLTRDMYYNDLTVTSTLTTNGYKIFVAGTISGNGTIDFGTAVAGTAGNNGSGGSGGAGGGGGTSTGAGQFVTTPGAGGSAGLLSGNSPVTPAVSKTSSIGSSGAAGGNGAGNGSGGGAAGTASSYAKPGVLANLSLLGVDYKSDGTFIPFQGGAGAGGGSGGSGNGSAHGGGGGGGGASGGVVFIVAKIWAGTFTIKAQGANGGNGGAPNFGGTYGGGGGGGGAGGCSFVIYGTKTWTGSYNITGGTGGTGSGSGANGTNGAAGTSYELSMTALTR